MGSTASPSALNYTINIAVNDKLWSPTARLTSFVVTRFCLDNCKSYTVVSLQNGYAFPWVLKLFLSGITCLVPSMTWVKLKLETILKRSSKFQSFFFNTKCQKLIKRSKIDLNQSGNIKCRMIVICIMYVPRKIKFIRSIQLDSTAPLCAREKQKGGHNHGRGGRKNGVFTGHNTVHMYMTVWWKCSKFKYA